MTGAKGPEIDPFPTNEALEAELEKERRETEDLLAAFDRPARGAARSVPSGGPGFVEYYAGDPATRAAERSPREPRPARAVPRRADLATVVKPQRRRAGVPPWLFWGGASASMLAVGFVVAVLTTRDPVATRHATPPAPTISAAAPVAAPALRMGRDEVPAPVPSQSGSAEAAPPATAAVATAPLTPPPRLRGEGSSAPHRPSGDGTAAPPPPTSRPAEDGPIRRL